MAKWVLLHVALLTSQNLLMIVNEDLTIAVLRVLDLELWEDRRDSKYIANHSFPFQLNLNDAFDAILRPETF